MEFSGTWLANINEGDQTMLLLAQPALRGRRADEPRAASSQAPSPPPLAVASQFDQMVERMPAAGGGSGRARRCGFVVWLHGLGDCGRANEFIAEHFSAAAFRDTRWAFPTAPTAAVTCNHDSFDRQLWMLMARCACVQKSVRDEEDVLRAVQIVHTMVDREIAAGRNPEDVFVFGLSQGGALSIASVLTYPRTLGGCAVFSGFLPFDSSSFAARVTGDAKKTPVLWIHGGADSLIPIQEGRDGVKFLLGLGMTCEFKVYDRLGHTLAPYELEYCERWASENTLSEHREEEGLKLKKGGLPGSKFLGGIFSCFSK
ncbi:hypothetical protein C2845_PM15G24860 [Panicum miliaceum]|uniref:Phospholipase/carboxylesterase/thioesterase domain-containing protein n=1 Tax=Panicum miliaceum TaxID=4540 RepID=A0A3L6Q5E0_PANMI|nr:hypothetical protein C2845_PM15G24860 [Panicum miliaceum]